MQDKQSTKEKSKFQRTDKRKILSWSMVIAVFITLSPLLFYVYQGFPESRSWESFFGTYTSNFYENVNVLAWVLFSKLVPFFLLLIWFFTCKHWWYHAILVPLSMYVFQIYNTLNDDLIFTDADETIYIIPIIAIIAALSYTIRTKIFDRLYGVDLDQEFKRVKWNGKIVKIPADSPLDLPEIDDNEISDEVDDNETTFMG